jgi:hypothetical protein
VRLRRQPDAEVHVRHRMLGLAGRADCPEDVTLRKVRSHTDADRPELDERDRVAVLRADRERQANARDGTGEADDAARGRADLGSRAGADIDSAVLSAEVGVVVGGEST